MGDHQPVYPLQTFAAAKVLLEANSRRWFQPFFARTTTVAEAARHLGEKPNSVLYRVNRWRKLGLVRVVGKNLQHGRIRLQYRSVADAFFVPHRITASEDLLELQHLLNGPYLEQMFKGLIAVGQAHSPHWGVRFDLAGNSIRITPAPEPVPAKNWEDFLPGLAPALWAIVPELRLDPEDAQVMRQELIDVINKYRQKGGRETYICCAGLAPTRLE